MTYIMAKDTKKYEVIRTFSIDNVVGRVGSKVVLDASQAKAVANFIKGGKAVAGDDNKEPTIAEVKAELKDRGVELKGATKLADLQALLVEAKAGDNAPA